MEHLRRAEHELRIAGADRERLAILSGPGSYLVNNRQEFAEADSLHRFAIALVDRMHAGPLALGEQYQNYATSLRRQHQLVQADSLYTLAMDTYRQVLEEDHVWVGIILGNVAVNQLALEEYEAALETAATKKLRPTYSIL